MAKYAVGTQGYDEQRYRRERRGMQRRYDLVSALAGLGSLAGVAGDLRRQREGEADMALEAEMLRKVYEGGGAEPPPPTDEQRQMLNAFGFGGPGQPPIVAHQPSPVQAEVLSSGRQKVGLADQFSALGRSFGFGNYTPRLRPEAQMRVLGAERGLRNAAEERANKSREFGLDERRVAAAERSARADETRANAPKAADAPDYETTLRQAVGEANKSESRAISIRRAMEAISSGNDQDMMTLMMDQAFQDEARNDPSLKAAIESATRAGLTSEQRAKATQDALKYLKQRAEAAESDAASYAKARRAYQLGPVHQATQATLFPPGLDDDQFTARWFQSEGLSDPAAAAADPSISTKLVNDLNAYRAKSGGR